MRIAIIDTSTSRAAIISDGLREAGLDDLVVIDASRPILAQLGEARPEVVLVNLENPSRDVLEDYFAMSRALARPIAMFVDQSDTEATTAAVDAGVSAYIVDGLTKSRIKPVLDLAVRRFQAFARLQDELMQKLHWSTPEGCSSCRPALNYYLLCALPGEYVDDQQSRFVNERMHANIQKDGTYSVVPRMWGGLTNPRELRAIADVVEKFNAPMVKVTTGQRLDIFGIKKEDLPAVWADFNAAGMVSGHAYGKSLRTVKTCVGSEWCRFGTQDSTGLGVKIEQATWGSWMPHKFKIAVSGCPRNCAEATIKDFGIICVDSGYELYVGGNGGIKVRVTDLLCKVATEAAAMEHCAAFVQLYREEAWYLERTAPWIERVGLAYVQSRLLDDAEARATLARQFFHAQSFSQSDPWQSALRARMRNCPSTLPKCVRWSWRWSWCHDRRVARCRPGQPNFARQRPHSAGARGPGNRDIPHARQRILRAGQLVSAQAGPAEPGHRPRQRRNLPAAQLEHLAQDR